MLKTTIEDPPPPRRLVLNHPTIRSPAPDTGKKKENTHSSKKNSFFVQHFIFPLTKYKIQQYNSDTLFHSP